MFSSSTYSSRSISPVELWPLCKLATTRSAPSESLAPRPVPVAVTADYWSPTAVPVSSFVTAESRCMGIQPVRTHRETHG
jgi:hypothetical protein